MRKGLTVVLASVLVLMGGLRNGLPLLAQGMPLRRSLSASAGERDGNYAGIVDGDAQRRGYLQVYDYTIADAAHFYQYAYEVYCQMTGADVVDQEGRGYILREPLDLLERAAFSQRVEKDYNLTYVHSAEPVDPATGGTGPAFVVRVTQNPLMKTYPIGLRAVYTAKADTLLEVYDVEGNAVGVLVEKGTELTYHLQLTVDDYRLSRMRFTPRYASGRRELKADGAFGVAGETLYGEMEQGADYTWRSAADILCAQINETEGRLRSLPRLYTSWTDRGLKEKVEGKTAFIRRFSAATVEGGRVQLILESPYLTYAGKDTVEPENICIYRVGADGALTDVTSTFRIGANSRGRRAFIASVSGLDTYIFTDSPL